METGLREFGEYTLVGRIAAGAMGEVWRARDLALRKTVAVKLIRPEHLGSEAARARFRTEAQAAARLNHPNIVTVYAAGEVEGQPYLAMQFIDGVTLHERLGAKEEFGTLTTKEAARTLSKIARALHHAHQRQVIHRDLKPSNVLIDGRGEPFVTDFGIAKILDDPAGLTGPGQSPGTPLYMAPEQCAGLQPTTAVDVWALGAVFFEMITGRPVWVAEGVQSERNSVLAQLAASEPPRLREIFPATDRDLDVICDHCLRRDPNDRYPSAAAVADELDRWLAGEAITARVPSARERILLWCRRKPAMAALTAALLTSLLGGLAATGWQWSRATLAQSSAQRHLYAADIRLAQQALSAGLTGRARLLLEAHRTAKGADERGFEWYMLYQLAHPQHPGVIPYGDRIHGLDINAAEDRLAIAGAKGCSWIDLKSAQVLLHWPMPVVPMDRTVVISPPGDELIVADLFGVHWHRLGIEESAPEFLSVFTNPANRVAFSPGGRRFAACLASPEEQPQLGQLVVFHQNPPTPDRILEDAAGSTMRWADEEHIDVVGTRGGVRRWSVVTGEFTQLTPDGQRIIGSAFDSAGRWLGTASIDGKIIVRETQGWRIVMEARGVSRDLHLAFSQDGKNLFVAGGHHLIESWSVPSGERNRSYMDHEEVVTSLIALRNGELVSGGADSTVRHWRPDQRQTTPVRELTHAASMGLLSAPIFSADGKYIAGCAESRLDGELQVIWDLETGQRVGELPGRPLLQTPDGWVCLSADGVFSLFPQDTSRPVTIGFRHSRVTNAVQTEVTILPSPMLFSLDHQNVLWVEALEKSAPPIRFPRTVTSFAPAPDGESVVLRVNDSSAILRWQPGTGSTHPLSDSIISDTYAFSASGNLLAMGGWDHRIYLVDYPATIPVGRAMKVPISLSGHLAAITALALAPNGQTLVSGGEDGTLRFWQTRSWRELAELVVGGRIAWLRFSPDGRRLVAGTLAGVERPGKYVIYSADDAPKTDVNTVGTSGGFDWKRWMETGRQRVGVEP